MSPDNQPTTRALPTDGVTATTEAKQGNNMSRDQETIRTARMGGRMSETAWIRTRAVLSLGMVLGLGAVGTMAAWSGSTTATSGMFSTGSIRLELNGQHPNLSLIHI